MPTLIPQLTNHIGFVIDQSGSMDGLSSTVQTVFNAQIQYLQKRSQELNQETRVSIYLFNHNSQCVVFDMDVMRPISLESLYKPSGQTALIDATMTVLSDLAKVPELHSDHAFLIYVLTDGEENISRRNTAHDLRAKLSTLPQNWTVACLVPNAAAKYEAKKFGFIDGNIETWTTTTTGLETAGNTIIRATENYLVNRSKGIRSSSTLFATPDTSKLSASTVKAKLQEIPVNQYSVFPVFGEGQVIQPFVEAATGKTYRSGEAFYMLTKKEKIQARKQLAIRNRRDRKLYSGTNARALLGLPAGDIKVAPGDHGEWDIFVQSTSVNRKLVRGTQVLVIPSLTSHA